eukprot:scaffold5110_cov202-Prasinococcus_capsulatus_cf.AAC.1
MIGARPDGRRPDGRKMLLLLNEADDARVVAGGGRVRACVRAPTPPRRAPRLPLRRPRSIGRPIDRRPRGRGRHDRRAGARRRRREEEQQRQQRQQEEDAAAEAHAAGLVCPPGQGVRARAPRADAALALGGCIHVRARGRRRRRTSSQEGGGRRPPRGVGQPHSIVVAVVVVVAVAR